MTYILVWGDYPKLDSLTKRDKIQNKMRIDMISILFYKQHTSTPPILINNFQTTQNKRHALLASKRRLIDLQKVPF